MRKRKVGIGFIGGGVVSELHARAVRSCAEARFVGVYDLKGSRAKALARRFRGRSYKTIDELLADPDVDAVHVLTSPEAHLSSTVAALNAGKHVLLEKPVADRVSEIRKMIRCAEKNDRLLVPAHNYIYVPSVRRAKRLIADGSLGKISAFWMMYNLYHGEDLIRKYGSIYRVVCVHHAYSLLYLLGRPVRVMSIGSPGVHCRSETVPSTVSITCEMPDGAIANLWANFASNDITNDPWSVLYKVLGTKGGVCYSWNEAQFEDKTGPGFGMPGYVDAFECEVDYFVNQCILQGRPPLSSMQDALDALRIVEAAERSAKSKAGMVEMEY